MNKTNNTDVYTANSVNKLYMYILQMYYFSLKNGRMPFCLQKSAQTRNVLNRDYELK